MDEQTQQVISKIAEKHAMPEGDVKEIYDQKLQEAEEAGNEGTEAERRAQRLLFLAFKRREQSSSVKVEGVILSAGDRYDAVAYSREQALEVYQDNPPEAIREMQVAIACPPEEAGNITGNGVEVIGEKNGWAIITHPDNEGLLSYGFAERDPDTGQVNGSDDANTSVEDGWRLYPLDDREKFNSGEENPRYGMPTDKHNWTRRGLGLFSTPDHDSAKGLYTFRGKQSLAEPPLGEAIQFKARVNEADDRDVIYVNSTSDTKIEENPDLEITKTVDQLIEDNFEKGEWLFNLEELYEYMAEQDGRRTVIVKSDVASLDLEPNSNDTMRMVLSEFNFAGGEMTEREATVWIPAWHDKYIDFAANSRVYVIGRANMQDAYDPETGGRTSDRKEVTINASGIYADPTTKVPREDAEEISEEDIDFSGDSDEAEAAPSEGDW